MDLSSKNNGTKAKNSSGVAPPIEGQPAANNTPEEKARPIFFVSVIYLILKIQIYMRSNYFTRELDSLSFLKKMDNMFAVIYTFKVKSGMEADFLKGWSGLTQLIYKYEGSLGSKVHKMESLKYLAYAQWPSKEKWEMAGGNLPEKANYYRTLMKDSCDEINTVHEMDLVLDLTNEKLFEKK